MSLFEVDLDAATQTAAERQELETSGGVLFLRDTVHSVSRSCVAAAEEAIGHSPTSRPTRQDRCPSASARRAP
jgi:hypothetical protein